MRNVINMTKCYEVIGSYRAPRRQWANEKRQKKSLSLGGASSEAEHLR